MSAAIEAFFGDDKSGLSQLIANNMNNPEYLKQIVSIDNYDGWNGNKEYTIPDDEGRTKEIRLQTGDISPNALIVLYNAGVKHGELNQQFEPIYVSQAVYTTIEPYPYPYILQHPLTTNVPPILRHQVSLTSTAQLEQTKREEQTKQEAMQRETKQKAQQESEEREIRKALRKANREEQTKQEAMQRETKQKAQQEVEEWEDQETIKAVRKAKREQLSSSTPLAAQPITVERNSPTAAEKEKWAVGEKPATAVSKNVKRMCYTIVNAISDEAGERAYRRDIIRIKTINRNIRFILLRI